MTDTKLKEEEAAERDQEPHCSYELLRSPSVIDTEGRGQRD